MRRSCSDSLLTASRGNGVFGSDTLAAELANSRAFACDVTQPARCHSRNKPIVADRVAPEIETQVVAFALEQPAALSGFRRHQAVRPRLLRLR
jgi:hypothetical protein